MEMKRINENTIRVLIENEDLEARGIKFLDLLGGNQRQVESFFYSILEEVDIDEQFQNTDAITFQVMPNRNGLELFITKNSNPGEVMNMNFGQEDVVYPSTSWPNGNQDDDGESLLSMWQSDHGEDSSKAGNVNRSFVFQPDSFDDLIEIAQAVYLNDADTSVYYYKGKYFLHVYFYNKQFLQEDIKDEVANLLEYMQQSTVTGAVLAEHGKLIMEDKALEMIRRRFK